MVSLKGWEKRVGGFTEGMGKEATGHGLLQTPLQVSTDSAQRLCPPAHTISPEQNAISLEK